MGTPKSRENRIRRVADRHGVRLVKSRARDERANDFALLDHQTGGLVFGWNALGGYGASLDEIEDYLTGEDTAVDDASPRA